VDYRAFHWGPPAPNGYSQDECLIWHAVAEYHAGFDPSRLRHHPEPIPPSALLEYLGITFTNKEQEYIDNIARGLWAADNADSYIANARGWPDEQRAAYIARKGLPEAETMIYDPGLQLARKIARIWRKWQQMQGSNPPLERCQAGPLREFDINVDGMAHYGMLPDFLQDLRNIGLSKDDLAPLFRSAYDYVELWDTCRALAGVDARPTAQEIE
jgi:hypothetical protein